jgi:hypothetical protein
MKKRSTEVKNPFGVEFQESWNLWKEYKEEVHKFTYKSGISEQMAMSLVYKLSGGKEDIAISIIEQSIAAQWKGFFQLKNTDNGTGKGIIRNINDKLGTSDARIKVAKDW